MKRSFGNGRMGRGGGSGSGGSTGGGGMMRRAMGAVGYNGGVQDNVSSPSNKPVSNILSLSSPTSSTSTVSSYNNNVPISGSSFTSSRTAPLSSWHHTTTSFYDSDLWDWETVDGDEGNDEGKIGSTDNSVFGVVPSKDEVDDAVSSLRHFLASASYSQLMEDGLSSGSDKETMYQTTSPPNSSRRVSSDGSEIGWVEPYLTMQQSRGYERARVYDAFLLLQNEPSVQRAVVSLSSDKAVWEAVLNNDVVRELRKSYEAESGEENPYESESSPEAKSILKWILDSSKARLVELIDGVTRLLNEAFQPSRVEKDTKAEATEFQERLRSSLLLAIVVLFIVVMTRAARV